jgi:hypothetical protein
LKANGSASTSTTMAGTVTERPVFVMKDGVVVRRGAVR